MKVASIVQALAREEDGATMVEYGLLVAIIAMVCAGVIFGLGGSINNTFNNIDGCLATSSIC
ncbi:MAG: Flp family type IVb pilin [Gemmatimonadaceae bacterium]